MIDSRQLVSTPLACRRNSVPSHPPLAGAMVLVALPLLALLWGGCGTDPFPADIKADSSASIRIEAITPSQGPTGTRVTIRGGPFEDKIGVLFGAHAAVDPILVNTGMITAIAPPQLPGTVDVTVLSNQGQITVLGAFTYEAPVVRVDSIEPGFGPIEGGTLVTLRGAGIPANAGVLFGNVAAAQVTFVNDQLVTVITPAGPQGPVDVTVVHQGGNVVVPMQFLYGNGTPRDDGTDSDGDGLTDAQEEAGWEVWIDSFAQASTRTDTYFNVLHYAVTSDPLDPDTDGDGLTDDVEFLIKSDPRKKDSDDDGLRDAEEWNQWLTSPTSVDTDGDARGDPAAPLAPNQALFDGLELFEPSVLFLDPGDSARVVKPRATSPTLSDTDGDGVSDFDEFDSTIRNGVIADLPRLEYELVGDVDVRLMTEYAETEGETKETGVTLIESRTDTVASEQSNTIGWSFEVAQTIGIEAGSAETKTKVDTTLTAGIHGEHTWTNSVESSRTAGKETSEVTSKSKEFTETAAHGSIRTAIQLTNAGKTSFALDGLSVRVSQREKLKPLGDTSPATARKTIATLTPVFDTITLAPGETAGPFELAATGVNADAIKELMAMPDTLMLGTAALNLRDSSGLDYDFVREFTAAQTATLVIDFGDGELRTYTVATNVDRNPDSTYRGITMKRVLEEYLGLAPNDPKDGYRTFLDPNGSGFQVLRDLLDYRHTQRNGITRYCWNLISTDRAHTRVDFQSIVLRAGDFVQLIYSPDDDNDGVSNALAKATGIDQFPLTADDADGDGLSNKEEIIDGWIAFRDPSVPDTDQYATIMFATSSEDPAYPASQALGAPDGLAWAPASLDGIKASIHVRYDTPVYSNGAVIRELSGHGMIYQVDAVQNSNNALHTVWKGSDPTLPGAPRDFVVSWATTPYLVKGLRIWVDTDLSPNVQEQIDSIALRGRSVAGDPRERRVFSSPISPDADQDGLTDAQEKARASNPNDPDSDGDGLLDGADPFPIHTARTLYVQPGAPSGQNGNSWLTAYPRLQPAITRALNGQATSNDPTDDVSQIWVAAGTYKPNSRQDPIPLVNNLGVYGGFTGWDGVSFLGETKRGQRNINPLTNGCVISGDMNNNDTGAIDLDSSATGNRGDNCTTMLSAPTGIDASAVVDGFMLTGAYCREFTAGDSPGGALRCEFDAHPTIQNCLFLGNANQRYGAGIYLSGGPQPGETMVVRNCIFASNVGRAGGGVYVAPFGEVVFENCEFSRNDARRRTSQPGTELESTGGGARVRLSSAASRVHFNNCTFTGNQARNQGGGIYARGETSSGLGYLRVDRCRFTSNVTTIGARGGNFVGAGGGIYLDSSGSVSNSTFWDNRAGSNGGGMAVNDTLGALNSVGISNCTLAYNRVLPTQNGGWDGGGIIVWSASAVSVENTILWQNYYGTGAIPAWDASGAPLERHQIAAPSGTTMTSNCCLNGPGNFSGGSNLNADPLLTSLALGDLRLGDNSPCIDRGNTFVDLDPLLPGFQRLPQFDLFSNPRVVDGNGDGLEAVDIGAFEAPAQ